MKTEVSSP